MGYVAHLTHKRTIIPYDTNNYKAYQQHNFTRSEKYIGKKIEVLMFNVEEVIVDSTTKLKPSQLKGFLSKDTAEALHQHTSNKAVTNGTSYRQQCLN